MDFGMTFGVLQSTTQDLIGSVLVKKSSGFNCHRFMITTTDEVTLLVEHSPDGLDWYTLKTHAGGVGTTVKDTMELDRPWFNLRVSWSGNQGDVTVKLTQLYDRTEGTV